MMVTKTRAILNSFRFSFLRSSGVLGNGGFFGDEFVYDRFERRFVCADGSDRRAKGHSDLRLDRDTTMGEDQKEEEEEERQVGRRSSGCCVTYYSNHCSD